MGIKPLNSEKTLWQIRVDKRHPKTKMPIGISRQVKGNEKQAIRVHREMILELERKIEGSLRTRWSEVVENYLFHMRYKAKCTEKTVTNYRYYLEAYTLPPWKERAVDSILMQEIDALIESASAGKSEGQKQGLHKMIKAVFKYAKDTGSFFMIRCLAWLISRIKSN